MMKCSRMKTASQISADYRQVYKPLFILDLKDVDYPAYVPVDRAGSRANDAGFALFPATAIYIPTPFIHEVDPFLPPFFDEKSKLLS
jgi:hypothetical protein